ncbi:VanW family protein [Nonlabens sp. Asnod3-A02]|uniref:VanW family protein n=1 Tax=Nonlabens sp. Asnod3-A02 TaxID=3160579 RepID=UPI0038694D93
MIRKLVPKLLKIKWQLYKRSRKDRSSGFSDKIAVTRSTTWDLKHRLTVTQPIKNNAGAANKVLNIKLAFQHIDGLIIQPEETFSYWNSIPAPIAKNGFKKGRNLLSGKLQEDYGGGLCQLSGMLYIALLRAGIEIVERHHHSIDIYTEETRYTPLGSDATVVYGYKDLRFKNNLNQHIAFQIEFKEGKLDLHLLSDHPIKEQGVTWQLISTDSHKIVETKNGDGEVLAVSRYKV